MERISVGGGALRIEWPTVALILLCYLAWLAVGLLVWPDWPVLALAGLGVVLALQSSLMHEASHGHPTRSARLNEALIGLPIGLVWPYRRFKTIHLRHHADDRLTDPFDDPESYYQALWQHEELPGAMKMVLRVNNTMLGRMILNPWLGSVGFIISEARAMAAGDRVIRKAWLLHAAGLVVVLPLVAYGFGIPVWLYILGPVWLSQALISVRTFAEHQWSERPDGRTIIVERSPLSLLFLNNNLHLVHHKMPNVSWYRLPALFREKREEWIRMNGGYVFPNYIALFGAFAFKAKEPVVHPVLRRAPEPQRAYRPRVRTRSVGGLGGTAPVPAKPPKD
ncbi:fatty acid desaturase [Aquibium sp. LZ166]|uniref:Fatty acid desaturase n=1 Tax=Aquibium pacificus TaxID=3153579 RepID=A0ABV3SK77_9HYPH